MNLDTIATYIPYIISAIALVLALRKQKHEEVSIDAKTIQTFVETTEKVGKQYKELFTDFEKYKLEKTKEFAKLKKEIADLVQKNASLSASMVASISERKKIQNEIVRLQADNKKLREDNQALKTTNIEQANTIKKMMKWIEQLGNQLKDNNITPVIGEINLKL